MAYRSTAVLLSGYWGFEFDHPGEVLHTPDFVSADGRTIAGWTYNDASRVFLWSNVDLTPYCRADVNLDGLLTPDDLSDFITAFFESPPAPMAAWSGQGPPTPDDLADFITAFFDGC